MFRRTSGAGPLPCRFPRAGGDVPCCTAARRAVGKFSPCRRGCSAQAQDKKATKGVFPVQAGMFRSHYLSQRVGLGFPRAGGDVPASDINPDYLKKFSPCRRGCSAGARLWQRQTTVFPVQAGMFRYCKPTATCPTCFPRAGGDVPPLDLVAWDEQPFSPCRRGCSAWPAPPRWSSPVFPVQAGMFRQCV